jgi:signal recognition particle subunit SRP19
LKDYKQIVIWTDYFNSNLSREQGRRVPLDRSVRDPTVAELTEATKRLGYSAQAVSAKHPKRMIQASGYVNIPKKPDLSKSRLILEVAKHLSNVRGESVAASKDKPKKG